MKKFLMAAAALILVAGTAFAGPNANGTLIVHNTGVVFSFDDPEPPACGENLLGMCEDADVRVDEMGVYQVWHIYAAFPLGASPRLKAVSFGVQYDAALVVLGDGASCGNFELPTTGWPNPGTGTALTFPEAQTDPLAQIYWFAGIEYYGTVTSFDLVGHPTQGAVFADDSVPPIEDEVTDLGSLGFYQDGYLPCPALPEPGACCDEFGYCTITAPDECQGDFLGGLCEPNPCPPLIGACCIGMDNEICIITDYINCLEVEMGEWNGADVCDPNPCIPIPVEESSWGSIKATYR